MTCRASIIIDIGIIDTAFARVDMARYAIEEL